MLKINDVYCETRRLKINERFNALEFCDSGEQSCGIMFASAPDVSYYVYKDGEDIMTIEIGQLTIERLNSLDNELIGMYHELGNWKDVFEVMGV